MMKKFAITALLFSIVASAGFSAQADDIKKGDVLQALTNLHPDMAKRLLYTMNYQQPGLIPVCAEITVKSISGKRMVFDYKGVEFMLDYEKFAKQAGISFQQAAQDMFGKSCDQAKIDSLSDLDKEGIKTGTPQVGMTRDGVYFAMGRPPYHANPFLDAREWMYWRNRFARTAVEFDEKGIVTGIR